MTKHQQDTDEEGSSAIEYGIIIVSFGFLAAVLSFFMGSLFSSMFYTIGDCIEMNFDPECYSVHENTTDIETDGPMWWPHE